MIDKILAWAPTLVSIFGSGPWGLAGGLVAILGIGTGLAFLVAKLNKATDSRDLEQGGADVGEGAVDLRNQANENRDYMDKQKDEILKEGPPK